MSKRLAAMIMGHWPLLLALLLGLALRLALWGNLPRTGLISDEAEYLAAADWLASGRGFAWYLGWLWTRAPLYPIFLAAHFALFGRSLEPIFVSQTILSLVNVALVYGLAATMGAGGWVLGVGTQAAGGGALSKTVRRLIPSIAALLAALYLPFASYAQLVLSETLFTTLLLTAFLVLGYWARGRYAHWGLLALGGLLLGFSTLTRGLALGFVPIVGLWAAWQSWGRASVARSGPPWREALRVFCILLFAFCILLLPWSLYASRAYGGLVVVDTTGAFNLLLGARTAFDGGRNDEPVRSFVVALLDPQLTPEARAALLGERRGRDGDLLRRGACLYERRDPNLLAALARPVAEISQAERQRLMSAEASCLLRAAPGAFVAKSLGELIDLFQINYTGDERLARGFSLGRLPAWYALSLFALDDTLYVLALPLAVLGWGLLRLQSAECRVQSAAQSALCTLIGLWLLFNLATAPLLFAINRFRVPLMPFVFVLAAYGLVLLARGGWRKLLVTRYGLACATLAALLGLIAATPYAYLEPRQPGAPSRWASYLGPHPSSLAATVQALTARPGYLREQALAAALGAGDLADASVALAAPGLPPYAAAVGGPLLDGLAGRPAEGLDRLAGQAAQPLEGWQRNLVAGELLRRMGNLVAARAELGPVAVDSENPVEWAWQWLSPPPLAGNRIDLADDNDLGYIRGFYLGRYDPDLQATVRWATNEAQLRFPGAASGEPQQICLRLSGLGWPSDLALPPVTIFAGEQMLGELPLTAQLTTGCLSLPAAPTGSTVLISLRAPSFVPPAGDLLAQQGSQVGQLRRLAFQLDWAEVRIEN